MHVLFVVILYADQFLLSPPRQHVTPPDFVIHLIYNSQSQEIAKVKISHPRGRMGTAKRLETDKFKTNKKIQYVNKLEAQV